MDAGMAKAENDLVVISGAIRTDAIEKTNNQIIKIRPFLLFCEPPESPPNKLPKEKSKIPQPTIIVK